MISNQLLQKAIDKIKAISGADIAVLNLNGEVAVRTYTEGEINRDAVQLFAKSGNDEVSIEGHRLVKVKDDSREEYILAVKEGGAEASVVAGLARLQIETLIEAYKERFDKDNFFKALLMDNMLVIDIYDRARRLHIESESYRAAIIVELKDKKRNEIMDVVKGIFTTSNEDFVTPVTKREIVVIKKGETSENYEQLDNIAKKLQNAIKREIGDEVRISYGSIVADLKEMSRSYKEARMAMEISSIFFENRSINPYNKLDIGRLIYQLPLPLCRLFIKEIFGDTSIEDMDEETIETINKFFENSLNVSETSRQLYIHRNTLVYRLDKIQKTTGLDLRVFEDAITFKIALMVSRYMKYIESQK